MFAKQIRSLYPDKDRPHERKLFKANIPAFLDGILLAGLLFAIFITGDHVIRHRNPSAAINGRPVGNCIADIFLRTFPESSFLLWLHGVPDLVIAIPVVAMTTISMHMCALADPGIIPRSWGDEAIARRDRDKAGGGGGAIISVDMSKATSAAPPAATDTAAGSPASASAPGPTSPGSDDTGAGGPSPVASPTSLGTARQPSTLPPAPGWTYCNTCRLWRPPRGHHDKYTFCCISRFDHFCVWVDTQIGICNHKCFFLCLAYLHFIIMYWWVIFYRFTFVDSVGAWIKDLTTTIPTLLMVLYTLFTIPTGLFCGMFVLTQFWGLIQDETTVERNMRASPRPGTVIHSVPTDSDEDLDSQPMWDEYGRLARPPKKGCLKRWCFQKPRRYYKNFCTIMGPPWLWLVPQLVPNENPLTKNQ